MSPGVRPVVLRAGDLTLSALLAEPSGPPRATVVAVHGGGTGAGYFDGQAHPDVSLLTLGARLGYAVVALDRPGYGLSAAQAPSGRSLAEQTVALRAALAHLKGRRETGAGVFLLAHSFGGKLALAYAATDASSGPGPGPGVAVPPPLLGLDISGLGRDYAVDPAVLTGLHGLGDRARNWGPLRFYPPGTFREASAVVAPVPAREFTDAGEWPDRFTEAAGRVGVPVRLTFAECERWWRHDEEAVAGLTADFTSAPRVRVDRQPGAGHNISLGWQARAYHLRAFAFFEECLARRPAARASHDADRKAP
ncbi:MULTISPECIES: alpha/beta hydrolase [unclassified Streptomyces]|uniref:alpha/beta hydrolase n=1 Tax=unclassified Streptomyces TaxID=2593676 RepID=UPI001660E41B|nr:MULTISPECIES: alpha/beta hydrolase [unclassified Streptomyces]MBD0707905.1 alpha/beta hydrolase [Streptomyces sp. CBMA291]MBD0717606.1 alpha/beta hydrolase [Streptomyces sp. CBMA370]